MGVRGAAAPRFIKSCAPPPTQRGGGAGDPPAAGLWPAGFAAKPPPLPLFRPRDRRGGPARGRGGPRPRAAQDQPNRGRGPGQRRGPGARPRGESQTAAGGARTARPRAGTTTTGPEGDQGGGQSTGGAGGFLFPRAPPSAMAGAGTGDQNKSNAAGYHRCPGLAPGQPGRRTGGACAPPRTRAGTRTTS